MQGTIYKRVRHQCEAGKPRWMRLPNPTPKVFPCPTCGSNLTKEKETRYDCSWWAGGKKRSKTFDAKHTAARFLTSAVTETHNGTYQQTRAVVMSAVFDEWEKHLDVKQQQGRLKPSTKKAYLSMLRKHLRPAFGACRSDKLTVNVVQEWERRCAAALSEGTMSGKFYNNVRGTLSVVLSWARGRGQRYLTHDPLTEIRPVPVERQERRFLEPGEIAALLDAGEGERDRTILYLLAYSGLRRGELFGLQWSDLDETTNRLQVRRSLFQGALTRPKTQHSERTVDLPEPIVVRLQVYRGQYPSIGEGFVFRTEKGHPLDPDNWYKRTFVPTVKRAGLTVDVGIHSMRHSYASLLINQGESIKYVSRQLGHASINITADLYGHLFRETSVSAMERLSQQVHGTPGTPDIHQNEPEGAVTGRSSQKVM